MIIGCNGLPNQIPLPSSGSSPKHPETLPTLFCGELWPQGRTQKASVEEKHAVLRSHSSSPFLEASQIIRTQIATSFQCQTHQALEGRLVRHLGWATKTKSFGLGPSGILDGKSSWTCCWENYEGKTKIEISRLDRNDEICRTYFVLCVSMHMTKWSFYNNFGHI
jgi:hypothetical protein